MGLDLVEFVLAIEESCRIEIPDSTVGEMRTPADVIEFVSAELRQRPDDQIRPLVAELVRLLTIQQLGVKPRKYREDARFVEDFGAD